MNRTVLPALALGLATALLVGVVTPAGASPATHAKGVPAPAAPTSAARSSKIPAASPTAPLTNYQQVTSASLVDAANTQSYGTATCPRGFRAVGGGAIISSTSLAEDLNGSIPTTDPRTWGAWVNNRGGTDGTFTVYAVCVKGLIGYTVVTSGGYADPPGLNEATQPVATCPRGKFVLGGGGYTTSASNLVLMAGSTPGSTGRAWYSAYYNSSSGSTTDYAYAVCAKKPDGYSVVEGAGVNVAPGTQGGASASCGTGQVVLGGGGSPNVFYDQTIHLNSSGPISSTAWRAWLNNGYSNTAGFLPAATCATFG